VGVARIELVRINTDKPPRGVNQCPAVVSGKLTRNAMPRNVNTKKLIGWILGIIITVDGMLIAKCQFSVRLFNFCPSQGDKFTVY
jgi:hypothetical protein